MSHNVGHPNEGDCNSSSPVKIEGHDTTFNPPLVLLSASRQGPVLILAVQPLCLVQSKLSLLELVQEHVPLWKSHGQPQRSASSSDLSEQSLWKSHVLLMLTQADPSRQLKHDGWVGVGVGVGSPLKKVR